ncbi:MAG: c-type cytochrome [Longimicrobiales bacterium]
MSENIHHDDHGHDDHHVNYTKIYLTLLVLFVISVLGPELGIRWVTLITAFGIAIVKARLVVNNFMHLAWEKRIVKWVLATSLILMFLMVAGVAPDVMNHEGNNWENVAAKAEVERGLAYMAGYEGEEEEEGEAEVVVAAGFNAEVSFGQICATCHGAGGAGDGVAGAALDPPPASFTDPAFWETRDRERIKTVIRDGAAAVGGSALMAPWGALYTEEQLDQVTDYVMSFNPGNE